MQHLKPLKTALILTGILLFTFSCQDNSDLNKINFDSFPEEKAIEGKICEMENETWNLEPGTWNLEQSLHPLNS